MSDLSSDEEMLPTQLMGIAGLNSNPMGIPMVGNIDRTRQIDGSQGYLTNGSNASFSDDSETELLPRVSKFGYGAVKSPEPGITLAFRELSATVTHKQGWYSRLVHNERPKVTKVLNNVSGAVKAGTLLALMGSSGAGKSTLMNALAQRTSRNMIVNGELLINGCHANQDIVHLAGYVHQDDLFVGSLTVKEHLTFMARLRMDRKTKASARAARIDDLIRELGLFKCRNTRIGIPNMDKSLSGGERKRLSFATEIITDPPLLFCDEPTTGLDSYNAKKLVRMMKDMAARGKTIICTIHQPSSEVFAMFDRLMLLAEGRLAYLGTAQGALTFFEGLGHKCPATFNPADFYIHTLAVQPGHENESRKRIRRIADNFTVSDHAKEFEQIIYEQESLLSVNSSLSSLSREPIMESTPKKPGLHVQMWWLTWRSLVDSYRNPAIHTLRILQKILIALVIGVCFANVQLNQTGIQNIQGVLFVFITENTFPSMYGVLNIFPQELPLFLREYKNGIYRCDAYYFSKVVSLIPGFTADPVVFILVCYFMIGLRLSFYHFFLTALALVFTANVAASCGAMFSAMFESIPLIMLMLIPLDVVLLISGGLFINLTTMSSYVGWMKYISWFMYSNEVVTITQWQGITNITCDATAGLACITTGHQVIAEKGFDEGDLYPDFVWLTILFLGFHTLGFLGLKLRARKI